MSGNPVTSAGRVSSIVGPWRSFLKGRPGTLWSCLAYVGACAAALTTLYFLTSEPTAAMANYARPIAGWLGTGVTLGLLVLAFFRRGISWNASELDPLFNLLASRWRGLLIGYGLLLVAWGVASSLLQVGAWTNLFPALFSNHDRERGDYLVANIVITAVFFALQALFVSGAGRVTVQRGAQPPWKVTASLMIFACALAVEGAGLMGAVLQMLDRIGGSAGRSLPFDDTDYVLAAILGGVWIFWFSVGWVLVRNVDRDRGIGRLLAMMLAGSWLEFAVALPVELVTRERTKDCPCASGSWLALLVAGPLLLWAIGPGIYLLYRREYRLSADDPGHARRILQRKSRRARVAAR